MKALGINLLWNNGLLDDLQTTLGDLDSSKATQHVGALLIVQGLSLNAGPWYVFLACATPLTPLAANH